VKSLGLSKYSDEFEEIFTSTEKIVPLLLSLDAEEIIDFASRKQPKATILTEAAAFTFASEYFVWRLFI
jgi:hypothetical protein